MTKRSLARRTPTRRAPGRGPGLGLTRAHKRWIGGLALLAVAFWTMAGLLALLPGALLRWWLTVLEHGIGWGVYLVPPVLAVAGAWTIARLRWQQPAAPPARLAGALLLFVSALALSHHVGGPSAPAGRTGGAVGRLVSEAMLRWLGWGGGAVVLIALAGIALILALNVSWAEAIADTGRLMARIAGWVRKRRAGRRRRSEAQAAAQTAPPIQAVLPQPTSLVPPPPPAVERRDPPPERPPSAAPPAAAPSMATSPPNPPAESDEARVTDPLAGRFVSWQLPPIEDLLTDREEAEMNVSDMRAKARIIEETLRSLGAPATVVEVNPGPVVTQFGLEPGYVERRDRQGNVKRAKIRVSRIQALSNDLALALEASPIRIEAPVPGKGVVGLEIPNAEPALVSLRGVMASELFRALASSPLALALGRDVSGAAVVADLAKLPHLLIAGATGSGKSVCINALVACLLCRCTPDDLRLLMIDPKRVELSAFNGVPHLLAPVVVEVDRVVGVLNWVTREMDRRYRAFARVGARHLEAYNAQATARNEPTMPLIVCFIDELADLMMAAPDEVERSICRIAQMARATGIHLVIATQRPSVDVVTGLIKANFPARIAFAVSSQTDSRVILDTPGADKLLGQGDALFMSPDSAQLVRMQGCYVSDAELAAVVSLWRAQRPAPTGGTAPARGPLVQQALWSGDGTGSGHPSEGCRPTDTRHLADEGDGGDEDPLLNEARALVTAEGRASVSFLQRRLRIGYSRAARLLALLERRGGVSAADGGPRQVIPAPPHAGRDEDWAEGEG